MARFKFVLWALFLWLRLMLRFKLREVLSCFVVGLMMIVAIKLVLGDGVEDEDVFDVFLDDSAGAVFEGFGLLQWLN